MACVETLFVQALEAHQRKDFQRAKQCYEQAIHLKPDYLEAHFNLGLLFLAQSKHEAAIAQFKQILATKADSIQAHWQLACIYWQNNNLQQVHSHYQKLLQLIPHSVALLNNLGALALKQNQLESAIKYFQQALLIEPQHKNARNNLAFSLLQKNALKESIWHYSLYLNLEPNDKEALYNRAVGFMLNGQLYQAQYDLKKLLKHSPDHIDVHCNLATIYLKLNKKNAALATYNHVLRLQKDHPIASYMLSALTQYAIPHAPPLEYIRNLFDNYALQFDFHLKKILNYQMPELLYALITPHIKKKCHILDLGCGTGLSGIPFIEIAEYLTGIDISHKMLIQAKKKNCYDELIEIDILTGLEALQKQYHLIICIDALVYFGELEKLFAAIVPRLASQGLFGFSIEMAEHAIITYQLKTSGRYQHAVPYIKKIAAQNNLKCLKQQTVVGRFQEKAAVNSVLFLFQNNNFGN
jgi:predicted TPR repeat methyltransferase